jgi:lipoyl(octanoyl) transferase
MNVVDLGLIEFSEAYAIQEQLVEEVSAGSASETLLLLEHPPVYTIGSGGREENILESGVSAVRINRGGDVTFHGPGQLVGYPIVHLARRRRDLHRYLRFLEELLIVTAADYRVSGCRVAGRTGVWTQSRMPEAALAKIASIGVGVRRWVTMHGFALNVAPDLGGFGRINPCGIENCPITSLEAESGVAVTVGEVKSRIGERFEAMLDEWLPVERGLPALPKPV